MLEPLVKAGESVSEELVDVLSVSEKVVQEDVKHFILDLEEIRVVIFVSVVLVDLHNEMETCVVDEVEVDITEVMLGNVESDSNVDDVVKSDTAVVVIVNFMDKEANYVLTNVVEMVSVETKRILARSNTFMHLVLVFIDVLHDLNEQGNVDFIHSLVKSELSYDKRIKDDIMEVKTIGKLHAIVELHKDVEISGIVGSPEVVDSIDFHVA